VRLALISDQHGNDVAFRVALEDVERLGLEEIVCLGDVVQGGTEPAQTLDRLASLGCETVLGNADAFLLEVPADSAEPVTERQLEVRDWTLRIGDALYVNPGSVGISYDRYEDPPVLRPLAEWALVTVADGTIAGEFRQVPYAVEDVRDAAKQSGRPYADEWAAQWPATPRP
jgi:hypothetical protein